MYRDLVKVWHPDRFGSDPRLRSKAEEKLAQINDAYRALRDYDGTDADPADAGRTDTSTSSPTAVQTARKHTRSAWRTWTGPFLFGLAGLLLMPLGTYLYFLFHSGTTSPLTATGQSAAIIATTGTSAPAVDAQPRKIAPHVNPVAPSASQPFQVRILSKAESAQIEAVCGTGKHRRDTMAYAACVQAEISSLEKTSKLANQTSAQERDAIEAACSADKLRHDDAGYARCVAWQKSDLETSSDRPDFSAVSEADRKSMEAACSDSRKLGPVAYDHCLIQMIRTLARSK